MAASFPKTWAATRLTASGITGLTLPGIMLDPGSIAGRSISPSAVLGPEFRRRRSLDIFIRLVAIVFKSPLASKQASLLCIVSNVFSALRNDKLVRRLISAMAASAYFG